jgi:hypothetical protein
MLRDSLAVYQTSSVTTAAFSTHGSVVRVTGELDLALAPRLEHAIAGEIRRGHRHLVIDLTDATFLDYSTSSRTQTKPPSRPGTRIANTSRAGAAQPLSRNRRIPSAR